MNPLRVLVAEDNEDHRYLMVRALRKAALMPLEIREARDGAEVLDQLRRTESQGEPLPHLVFLDLKMPKMDGLEVLRRVKNAPAFAQIPVVVLTSSDRQEDIDAAYEFGTNGYVTKALYGDLPDSLSSTAEFWTVWAKLPGLAA
jgi:CheY-like chemotaxis protein